MHGVPLGAGLPYRVSADSASASGAKRQRRRTPCSLLPRTRFGRAGVIRADARKRLAKQACRALLLALLQVVHLERLASERYRAPIREGAGAWPSGCSAGRRTGGSD
jgi:hypothetical protein